MSSKLTSREDAILTVIKESILQKGYPPSVREIGQKVGLSSSSTVHNYLKRLEDKGVIRRDPTKPRAIEVLGMEPREQPTTFNWVPVLGRVAAGLPVLAVENREAFFPLPVDFTGHGEFFMLTVKGESMIDVGIFDGDLVIVRKQSTANNGDIVVALLEDESTVKRFYKEKDYIKLKPENKNMAPIITRDATILGTVIGLLRRM
jgi:repressor LexA